MYNEIQQSKPLNVLIKDPFQYDLNICNKIYEKKLTETPKYKSIFALDLKQTKAFNKSDIILDSESSQQTPPSKFRPVNQTNFLKARLPPLLVLQQKQLEKVQKYPRNLEIEDLESQSINRCMTDMIENGLNNMQAHALKCPDYSCLQKLKLQNIEIVSILCRLGKENWSEEMSKMQELDRKKLRLQSHDMPAMQPFFLLELWTPSEQFLTQKVNCSVYNKLFQIKRQ
eukprot:403353234